MPVKVNCSYCGKEFYKRPNEVSKAKKHFCCKDHFYKYRRKYNYPPPNKGIKHHMKLKILAKRKKNK